MHKRKSSKTNKMSKPDLQDTVLISADSLLPIIQKHLNKLTSVQWALIGAGQLDSNSQALLVGLVEDIIQKTTADVFEIVLPLFQQKTGSAGNAKTLMGDAISKGFAQCFDLSEVKGKTIRELTHMVEERVNEKVNSLLSEAVNCVKCRKKCKPSSFTSNLKRWLSTVFDTAKILGSCIRRSKISQIVDSVDVNQSESDQLTDHESIDYPFYIDGVVEILQKWTLDEDEDISIASVPKDEDFYAQASSIVSVLMETMVNYSLTDPRTFSLHPPDMSAVVNPVRDFLIKHIPGPHEQMWLHFFEFASDKVNTTVQTLRRKATYSFFFSLEDPEEEKTYTPVNQDFVIDKCVDLFHSINELREPSLQDSITCCGLLEEFSQELIEILFQDAMHQYQQILLTTPRALSRNEKNHLHKVTIEIVETLVAEMLLWFKINLTHSDRVSGALEDIENLMVYQERIISTSSMEDELSCDELSNVSSEENELSDVTPGENELSNEASWENDFSSATEDKHENDHCWSSSSPCERVFETELFEFPKPGEIPKDSNTMVILLLVWALSYYMKKTKRSQEKDEIQTIIQHLSDLTLPDNNSELLSKEEEMREILETLRKYFGSSEGLLKATMALEDPSFIQTIIACLKEKLNVTTEPRKKSRAKIFFSQVGKVMTRFFRCLFKTSE